MEILILFSIICLAAGFFAGWLILGRKVKKTNDIIADKDKELFEKHSQTTILQNIIDSQKIQVDDLKKELEQERIKGNDFATQMTKEKERNNYLAEKLDNQKKEIEELQKKLILDFENIANKILKQNTEDFSQTHQKKIDEILIPVKEKLQNFEKQIHETYEKGLKDQTDLKAEILKLQQLNTSIGIEAQNLTKALKGDVKKQGNWGEMVLDRILERSGLIKGQEYDNQFSSRNDNGELIRPDVIIRLPDNKHIIIDSKVSLIAWDHLVNAETQENKDKFVKQHIESVRNHVKNLSDKSYAHADKINSPDFVLLFMPIESSFSFTVQQDVDLFNFAWDKRVVIVGPSTLLATLKTIESIWKREKQTLNALEIASEGGKLYDKFVSLMEDMEKIGKQLDTVTNTYNEARKKLDKGSGNLVGKIHKLHQLGAKNQKSLPPEMVNKAELFDNPNADENI